MKILVTGAGGFIGKNLISTLKHDKRYCIFEYDIDSETALLEEYTGKCDFVVHLAGVNRPKSDSEFAEGNTGFTEKLLGLLQQNNNKSPIVMSSSTQAELDNPYGKSKKAAEQLVFDYAQKNGVPVYVYRLPNVFGKWCRPNYNSAVATFCHNIARGLPITVNDPATVMNLVYIDDVVAEFMRVLDGDSKEFFDETANRNGQYCAVEPVHTVKLGEIVTLLESFRDSRKTLEIPDLSDHFTKKLYSTYLSYLPGSEFSYPLTMHEDERGSFTEIFRTPERGQVSVNISKPGVTKGNHWHQTKNEKFLVVSGEGIIRFRRIDGGNTDVIEYHVNGQKLQVVDIPPGYTHNIENTGKTDMVTIMWVNECYNPENPDTYALNV